MFAMTRPARRLAATGVVASLVLLALVIPPRADAIDTSRGYGGACTGSDAQTGTTFVIDFRELDGNDGKPAEKIVRCSPGEAGKPRTGLQAMKDAGIRIDGVARWGESFICRIEGRPAANEPIPITSYPNYTEQCIDTPPAAGYWGYWHADGKGEDWQYSQYGVTNRTVTPGGFEGWSFSLNATAETNPKPGYEPVNNAIDPDAPTVSISSSLLTPPLVLGKSVTLSWSSAKAARLVASGDWSGELTPVASGSRIITPSRAGDHTFVIEATGTDGSKVQTSYTLKVVSGGSVPDPEPVPVNTSGAAATAAWLIRELVSGGMPAPIPTEDQPTDWGLTIDTLWALYAAGTGSSTARTVTSAVDLNAGDYMGIKLFKDTGVRRAGQTAKLLLAAVVAGKDPRSFGRVMRADGRVTPQRYDLRAETERLVNTTTGRLSDRGLGIDNTNTFSQSLAVMGLARSGGVDRLPVDYLIRQQCSAGYWRMFDRHGKTCDQDKDAPDGDGTAMGIQALMTARDAGVTGLDPAIDRGVEWLLEVQRPDGSFGGGVSTEGSNANSTGLIAQTLHAAGRSAAYKRAAGYVRSLAVTKSNGAGNRLANEIGAIAYNRESLVGAKRDGIRGRDQWRRASAQAIFALAPVSFADLGKKPLTRDPIKRPPLEEGSPAVPPKPNGTKAAPSTVVTPPADSSSTTEAGSATPAGQLGRYLAGQLMGGDHIEVEQDGKRYVSYDLTTQVVMALRQLGEQPKAAHRAARFVLDKRSIAAFAAGAPYEKADAAYAEPLAKLQLVAASTPGKKAQKTAARLAEKLAAIRGSGGVFTDTGTYADKTASTSRHAWAILSTVASAESADDAIEVLAASRCADGGFPAELGEKCEVGDLAATALGVQAVNVTSGSSLDLPAVKPVSASTEDAPDGWSDQRWDALVEAASSLQQAGAPNGGLIDADAGRSPALISEVAGGKQAVGLDVRASSTLLAAMLQKDGGAPTRRGITTSDLAASAAAAPGLVGRSWLSTPGLSLTAAVQVPVGRPDAPTQVAAQGRAAVDGWLLAAGGTGVLVLVAAAFGAGLAMRRRPVAHSRSSAATEMT